MRIFLIGFMGSGKTTVGKKLASKLGYLFMDMDQIIEKENGMPISRIFRDKGEPEFRRMEHEFILRIIKMDNVVISTGGGVPCFHGNMDLINRHGISVYLKMEPELLLNRLRNSKSERPLISDLSPDKLISFVYSKLKEREPWYMKAKIVVNGLKINIKQLSDMIMQK